MVDSLVSPSCRLPPNSTATTLYLARHGRRFKKTAIVFQPWIACPLEFVKEPPLELFDNFSVLGIVRYVFHLVRILLHVEQFNSWTFIVGMIEIEFPLWFVAMRDNPGLGRASVFVRQCDKRILCKVFDRRRIVAVAESSVAAGRVLAAAARFNADESDVPQ